MTLGEFPFAIVSRYIASDGVDVLVYMSDYIISKILLFLDIARDVREQETGDSRITDRGEGVLLSFSILWEDRNSLYST